MSKEFENKINLIFQQRLSALIDDLECKRKDLPEILGISENVITKALNYGIVPKPIILIRISDKFSVSIDYLIGKNDKIEFYKTDNLSSFQERYKELRDERKLKNSQVSLFLQTEGSPIDRSYFSLWEKNKNYIPSLEFLELLANFFKVSIDYLLGRTDDR